MFERVFLASAVAVGFVGAANAADVPVVAPADWTGFYVGAGGGLNSVSADEQGYGSTRIQEYDPEDFSSSSNDRWQNDVEEWGGLATVEAGFDYQVDQFVIGVAGSYDFVGISAETDSQGECTNSDTDQFPCTTFSQGSFEIGDAWYLGARVGYLATASTLLFLSGGYTQAEVAHGGYHEYRESAKNYIWVSAGNEEWKQGYYLGAGIEQMLTEAISMKIEYRFADYGSVNESYSGTGLNDFDGPGYAIDEFEVNHKVEDILSQTIRATVNLRF
jgi:outer membrane immunogenic protein